MGQPSSDPPVADQAPTADVLTAYDQNHAVISLRLFDAEAEGADWAEVARIVLHTDPAREPERPHAGIRTSAHRHQACAVKKSQTKTQTKSTF